jgi:hypothetical protein
VTLVVANPEFLLDEVCHPWGRSTTESDSPEPLEAALLQRLEIASNSGGVPMIDIDAVSPENVTVYCARVNRERH